MAKRVVTTRRNLGSKKPMARVVLVPAKNGHLLGKPNGHGTAHRVEEAIRVSGCSATGEFFRVARHAFPNHAPEQCTHAPVLCTTAGEQLSWMAKELSWFGALGNGNPVPEGYKIPECARLLADKIFESKDRRKCFALLRNSSDRKPLRTLVSPSIEATQFP